MSAMRDFPPEAFFEVFSADERPILLGGQAVNLWARIYAPQMPALRRYEPFTSFDADIFGPPSLGVSIALQSGWSIMTNHDPRNPISAILTKSTPDGELRVDVLRSILGVSAAEIESSVDELEILPGKIFRIPTPQLLLKAKITNLRQLDNKRNDGSARNDLKHVSMLIPICELYIRHYVEDVREGRSSERDLINEMHALNKVIRSSAAAEVAQKYSLDFEQALPLDINADGLPKLANFYANLKRQAK